MLACAIVYCPRQKYIATISITIVAISYEPPLMYMSNRFLQGTDVKLCERVYPGDVTRFNRFGSTAQKHSVQVFSNEDLKKW